MDQELIDRIYGAVIEPHAWHGVLRDVGQAFGAEAGVLAFSDNDTVLSEISVSFGPFAERSILGDYFSYFGAIDIAVPLFAALPAGKIVATSKAFSKRKLAHNEFYNDFFTRIGLADAAGGNLIRDDHGTGFFTIQRARGVANFSRRDVVALERLMPHFRRAVQLHRAFAPTRRAAVAFVEGFDAVPLGVVAIDADGRVWHRNRAAGEIVDRRDGLMLGRDAGLSAVDGTAAGRLAQLIGAVLAGEEPHAGGQVSVPRRDGKRPYRILVAPMPVAPTALFDTGVGRGALVLINDPDRVGRDDLAAAMARYRLTPAELKLLEGLVAGQSLRAYCDAHAISINTGKFHLRALFAKTEARGQVDLVRIALMAMTDG